MFRGSVKSTGYPLHSPVSPSVPLPCVTLCHHISTGIYYHTAWSQWTYGQRRGSAVPSWLGSRVRIPPRAWMFISYVVCCVGSGLCDGLITRPEESYWLCVCVIVCDVELATMRRSKGPSRAEVPQNVKVSSSRSSSGCLHKRLYRRSHSQSFERLPSVLSFLSVWQLGTTPLPVDVF